MWGRFEVPAWGRFAVLEAMRRYPGARSWAYGIADDAGLPRWRIQPILRQLVGDGLVARDWDRTRSGHPAAMYRLTRRGRADD